MTLLDDDRTDHEQDLGSDSGLTARPATRDSAGPTPPPPDVDEEDERPAMAAVIRPVLSAALVASAAGLVAGGIFGSWGARLTGLVGAFAGAGWTLLALRARRTSAVQSLFPFVAVVLAMAGVIGRGESPADLPTLVGDAIESGRLFRPPVPFDPGWTAILLVLTALLGFGASWVGAALNRSRLAVALPLPIVAVAAITQPDDGKFVTGVCAFLPTLAGLAVLFGGDARRSTDLGAAFELKRALRAALLAIPVLAALVAFNSASFLFPEPRFDPTDQPQKPKPVPLSQAVDRVLFEVDSDTDFTGPWRTGVLDVYDENAWKLPPFDRSRFEDIPADGVVSEIRADTPQEELTLTLRDLGDGAVLPTLGGTTRIVGDGLDRFVFDPRTQLLRVPEGRAPKDFAYVIELPPYATDDQLRDALPFDEADFAEQLDVPPAPPGVRRLLADAPDNPWDRLDFLRQELLGNVVAAGQGAPVDVPPARVDELLGEDGKGTPFEIAAAEALLARWAGVPSRVGFGFDGVNDEGGAFTVRPRNAAQWLEVWFEGYGWVPLVGAPEQAEATLDTDPNARFDPNVVPSDDVAVEIYLPFKLQDLQLLYERIRDQLLTWLPLVVALAVLWATWPALAKIHRRAKRRRWAATIGPRAQIAVEYAELRDLATDLSIADIYATPLEYVREVKADDEHAELSWLVARALYGDMTRTCTDADVQAAEQLSASVRRRLRQAQPVSMQLGAMISRASIRQPYSTEVPNIRIPRAPRLRLRLPRVRVRRPTRRLA